MKRGKAKGLVACKFLIGRIVTESEPSLSLFLFLKKTKEILNFTTKRISQWDIITVL